MNNISSILLFRRLFFFLSKCFITLIDIDPTKLILLPRHLIVFLQIIITHLEHLIDETLNLGSKFARANQNVGSIQTCFEQNRIILIFHIIKLGYSISDLFKTIIHQLFTFLSEIIVSNEYLIF